MICRRDLDPSIPGLPDEPDPAKLMSLSETAKPDLAHLPVGCRIFDVDI
jgi:hypothetical protein